MRSSTAGYSLGHQGRTDLTAVVSQVLLPPCISAISARMSSRSRDPRFGDESRRCGPAVHHGESAYFLSVNRNKRSCTVDLKSGAGREMALAIGGRCRIW